MLGDPRDPGYLLHILLSARLIREFVQGVNEEEFTRDLMRQDAIVRRIQIIGEATRRLSKAFRAAHPEIPWQDMAGMRSKLIHDYDKVDLHRVWEIVEHDIPALIAHIEPLVPPDTPDEPENAEK
jgi:uncharacterized protein with HEPN domain